MSILILILVIGGAAGYMMTPEERLRALKMARIAARDLCDVIQGGPAAFPFRVALSERTRWAFVTPALLVLNFVMFFLIAIGRGSVGEWNTLVSWGGNIGPLTTNGEWQRLLTSMFVHAGFFHLVVNLMGLAAVGFITERLVGSLTFASAYFAAGLMSSLVSVSVDPLGLSVGASGAIMGIYGLLLVVSVRDIVHASETRMPLVLAKWLSPLFALFLLYAAASGSIPFAGELAGFAVGVAGGIAVTYGVTEPKPHVRRIAMATGGAVVIAAVYAVPLAGIDDVRPEITMVATTEDRTARLYETEVARFRKGRTSATALVQTIDSTIIPELRLADARLKELDKVPDEQQPMVDRAVTFLKLREESWRLRADGLRKIASVRSPERPTGSRETSDEYRLRRLQDLHKSSTLTLREAETKERESLVALREMSALNQ
jgi:rhomboid protease GluP